MPVSPTEAQSHDSYLYHMTLAENVDSILDGGIQPMESDWIDDIYVQKANELIERVADETGKTCPFDRRESVFLFLTYDVTWKMTQLRNRDTGAEHAAVVVDAEQIESDLYMADGRAITDLMERLEVRDRGGDVDNEMLVNLAYKYVESIQRVTDYEAMADLDANPDEPIQEGIVEGGIQPDAIIGKVDME